SELADGDARRQRRNALQTWVARAPRRGATVRVICLTGSHIRRQYFAATLHERFGLCGMVIQAREEMIPEAPPGIDGRDRRNFVRHFTRRRAAEQEWFRRPERPAVATLEVDSR